MERKSTEKTNKEKIIKAIKESVIPVIRDSGFSGTFPHFRKKENGMFHFLSFQFGRSSLMGKLIVEFRAIEKENLPSWAKNLPENKLDYGVGRYRQRLGAKAKGEDGIWFDFQSLKKDSEFGSMALKIGELFSKEYPLFIKSLKEKR